MRVTPSVLLALLPLGLLVTACDDKPDDTEKPEDTVHGETGPEIVDEDLDGFTVADGDCDDTNPDVRPYRDEDCNGIDDNCNGFVDEGFSDLDADGIADCMDAEECDGVDNNGDGRIDEGFGDADGDGIADCAEGEDCDGLDNNGNGQIDEGYDADGDGYTQCGTESVPADCDDTNRSVSPGVSETSDDGIDNDCDGLVDEGGWAEGDLVVCEIMNNPNAVSDAYGEWIEIYNASGRTVYLNGLVISSTVDDDYHVVEDDTPIALEAGGLYMLGKSTDPDLNGAAPVQYSYQADVVLSNESDDIVLTADGVVLDIVAWDDGATMPDPTGASMVLDPDYLDSVQNDIPGVWCPGDLPWASWTDFGSPGTMNDYCSSWDHDGDGLSRDDGDCDDGDATVYPGAYETDPSLDNDCDGDVEWMPTAVVDYDPLTSTLYECDAVYLVGSGSWDPDGGALTYEWELVSAPSGSALTTSDIDTSTSADPVFWPDVVGDYTFSLVVTDPGGAPSYAESLTVTIVERPYQTAPVANAGADQTSSVSASCTLSGYTYVCDDCADTSFTLDASGSTDADGDELTYAWSASSSYATITDSTAESTTLTVSGVAATYGSTTTETITVTLSVEDCPGDSSTDTMTITFSCTGV